MEPQTSPKLEGAMSSLQEKELREVKRIRHVPQCHCGGGGGGDGANGENVTSG